MQKFLIYGLCLFCLVPILAFLINHTSGTIAIFVLIVAFFVWIGLESQILPEVISFLLKKGKKKIQKPHNKNN